MDSLPTSARKSVSFRGCLNCRNQAGDYETAWAQLTDPRVFRALRHHHGGTAQPVFPHARLWPLRMGRRGLAVRHVANARRAGQCAARLSAKRRHVAGLLRRVSHLCRKPARRRQALHRRISGRNDRPMDQRQGRPQPLLQSLDLCRFGDHRRRRPGSARRQRRGSFSAVAGRRLGLVLSRRREISRPHR